jgi:hypothetical protein
VQQLKISASFMAAIMLSIWCMSAMAQHVQIPTADSAQIDTTVKQYYDLSHPDASCLFSKTDHNGRPVDPKVHSRAFREAAYMRTFKGIFSHSLFAHMYDSCVGNSKATGMLDVRLWDSEIDTDPSNYGNDVRLKITQPLRIVQAGPLRVRVRVDWAEIVKGSAAYYAIGRTDLIMVKEAGVWLIDDAYTYGASNGSSKQFDMSIDDFDDMPGMTNGGVTFKYVRCT